MAEEGSPHAKGNARDRNRAGFDRRGRRVLAGCHAGRARVGLTAAGVPCPFRRFAEHAIQSGRPLLRDAITIALRAIGAAGLGSARSAEGSGRVIAAAQAETAAAADARRGAADKGTWRVRGCLAASSSVAAASIVAAESGTAGYRYG